MDRDLSDRMNVRADGFNLLFTLPIPEFAQKRNNLQPISLKDLIRIDNEKMIEKLQDAGVLHKELNCPKCNQACSLVARNDCGDKFCWRCKTKNCSRPKISIRTGFLFSLFFFFYSFFFDFFLFFPLSFC